MNRLRGRWFIFSLVAVGGCLAVASADERIAANGRRGPMPQEIGRASEIGQFIDDKLPGTGEDAPSPLIENEQGERDVVSDLREDAGEGIHLDQPATPDKADPDSLGKDTARSVLNARFFRSAPVRFVQNLTQSGKDALKQPASAETLSNRIGTAWERWTRKEQLRDALAEDPTVEVRLKSGQLTSASARLSPASPENSAETNRGPPAAPSGGQSSSSDRRGNRGWGKTAALGLMAAAAFIADGYSHYLLGTSLTHVFSMDPLTGNPYLVMFSTGAFIFGNVLCFFFVRPQIHKFFAGKRAPYVTLSIGMAASLLLAITSGYHGHLFWAYQNLYGAVALGSVIALQYFKPNFGGGSGRNPSRIDAIVNHSFASALVAAATYMPFVLGQHGFPGIASLPIGPWIVPMQIAASLGFAYLFFPEWFQLRFPQLFDKPAGEENREPAKGVSSLFVHGFLWGSLGVGVWVIHRIANILSPSPAWSGLQIAGIHLIQPISVIAGFIGITAALGWLLIRRLTRTNWNRLLEIREKLPVSPGVLGVGLSFVALSGLILSLIPLGHAVFDTFLTLPASLQLADDLSTLTVYLTENTMAIMVSLYMLDAIRKYRTPAKTS